MVWVWYDVMNKCDQRVELSNKNAPVVMSAICVGEYNWKKNCSFRQYRFVHKKTEKSKHDNQSRNLAFEYFPSSTYTITLTTMHTKTKAFTINCEKCECATSTKRYAMLAFIELKIYIRLKFKSKIPCVIVTPLKPERGTHCHSHIQLCHTNTHRQFFGRCSLFY